MIDKRKTKDDNNMPLFRHSLLAAVGFSTLIGLAGCERIDSANVSNQGLYLRAVADDLGKGQLRIHTALKTGGTWSNTYVELGPGESIHATVEGQKRELAGSRGLFGEQTYNAGFNLPIVTSQRTVSLDIQRKADAAILANIQIPAAFDIAQPAQWEQLDMQATPVFRITLSGNTNRQATYNAEISLDCHAANPASTTDRRATAVGRLSFDDISPAHGLQVSAQELLASLNLGTSELAHIGLNCEADVEITKALVKHGNPGVSGAYIAGRQVRRITLRLVRLSAPNGASAGAAGDLPYLTGSPVISNSSAPSQ